MAYCIYLRKSRADMEAEARGEGETLARHKRTLTDLAAQRRLPVAEIYAEIVSGETIAERPEMRRMLAAIESGAYEGVICMDVDRLGRGDGSDQARILKTLKYTHTLVITPYKVYDPAGSEIDEEFLEYSQQFARMEYRHIKRRMWAGRVASARAGKWQSPRAPYGYTRVKTADDAWTLEPVPIEADAVRMIYDWYGSDKMGKNNIANALNNMGLRTHLGARFVPSAIRTILANPVYLGKIRWCLRRTKTVIEDGREYQTRPLSDECMIYDGLHPAIITQAQWDAVQSRLADNPPPPCRASAKLSNPLAGLMYCSECGHAMSYTPMSNRNQAYAYKCITHGCPTSGIYANYIFAQLDEVLMAWQAMGDPQVDTARPAESAPDPRALRIAAAQSTLDALLAQRTKLQELVEVGAYTIPVYIERNALNEDRIKAATAELAEAQRAVAPEQAIIAHYEQITHILDVAGKVPAEELNALLKQVIAKIVYHKSKRCNRASNPAEHLTLDIYPKVD